jgi:hypothetical protein
MGSFMRSVASELDSPWTSGSSVLHVSIGETLVALTVFKIEGDTVTFLKFPIYLPTLSDEQTRTVEQYVARGLRDYFEYAGVSHIRTPIKPQLLKHVLSE